MKLTPMQTVDESVAANIFLEPARATKEKNDQYQTILLEKPK